MMIDAPGKTQLSELAGNINECSPYILYKPYVLFHICCYYIYFFSLNNFSILCAVDVVSRPGQSQGLLYKHLCH